MKKLILPLLIVFVGILFTYRLINLQLIGSKEDGPQQDPAIKTTTIYPTRGLMYDRNQQLLVSNQPAYDLMVIPREVKNLDTIELCQLIDIDKEEFVKSIEKAKRYSPRLPSVLVSKLSAATYAVLQEKMRKFEGFYIQKINLRKYHTDAGANLLGYISEVNDYEIQNNPGYIAGELIGRTGVEKQYETYLRGKKGINYIQKDRFNRTIGPYKEGIFDSVPVPGTNLELTIDKDLQEYGEDLMIGKRGGIVALDPKNGEILSLITGPNYDPALLVGRERSANYTQLYYDSIAKPTWNRALLAQPSPGSPFKILNALVALEEGVITTRSKVMCYNGFYVGNELKGCHCGGGIHDLREGIAVSCNAYFADTFKKIYAKFDKTSEGQDVWERHMKSFGLGDYLGYDLPTGAPGRIPSTAYYDRAYGKNRWFPTFIISNAIGQGEVAATPIQLANMTAAIANRGYFYTPHILKKIGNDPIVDPNFTEAKQTTISKKHFDPIINAMRDVYETGTAKWIQIPGVSIAGKTGTVENYTLIDGIKTQLTDHSLFIAFAPVEDPKIALAVYIEHGYYGARYAGHIASLMIEKYLKGEISRKDLERKMLEKTLEKEYAKPLSGEPFEINEYDW
jgi:penicillin-binding protein 2